MVDALEEDALIYRRGKNGQLFSNVAERAGKMDLDMTQVSARWVLKLLGSVKKWV